jgi:hypothetical protein
MQFEPLAADNTNTNMRDVDVRNPTRTAGPNQIRRRGTLRYPLFHRRRAPPAASARTIRSLAGDWAAGLPVRGRQAVLRIRFVRRALDEGEWSRGGQCTRETWSQVRPVREQNEGRTMRGSLAARPLCGLVPDYSRRAVR